MKTLPILLVLGFALSLCNITNKLKGVSSSGGSGTSTPAAPGSSDVEKAQPTAAQIATLAGGQEITWDDMVNCDQEFAPNADKFTMDGPPPIAADADGRYPVPEPGIKRGAKWQEYYV